MGFIFLLAIALSIDTFVLAISIGLSISEISKKKLERYALTFGVVQASLFSLGYLLSLVTDIHIKYSLHISFWVFLVLSVKMFLEFLSTEDNDFVDNSNIFKVAILTSIDAFIIGITPISYDTNILVNFVVIFLFTTILGYLGMYLAKQSKNIQIVEHYSLLIGSLLLLILALQSF